MNVFVTCFILAALLYVLTLPFVGQRAKKAHTEEKRNWGGYTWKSMLINTKS